MQTNEEKLRLSCSGNLFKVTAGKKESQIEAQLGQVCTLTEQKGFPAELTPLKFLKLKKIPGQLLECLNLEKQA